MFLRRLYSYSLNRDDFMPSLNNARLIFHDHFLNIEFIFVFRPIGIIILIYVQCGSEAEHQILNIHLISATLTWQCYC